MKQFTLSALALLLLTSSAQAATYTIDTAHTEVGFKVKHLGISNVRGKFVDFTGTFEFDPENIAASKTTATIKTASVDTANEKRDDHLRSPDFFNTEQHPIMSFTSKEVKNINGKSFTVSGDLTLNGITKQIDLAVEHTGVAIDPWGSQRAAFLATTTINRKDFGLTWNKLLEAGGVVVGDEVTIEIALQGIKETK